MNKGDTPRLRTCVYQLGLSLMLLALALGCGGPTVLPVTGEVVFGDGQPVETGRIEYNAVDSPWRAVGVIDKAGRFELLTAEGQKGLPAGEYEVIVAQLVITEDLSLAAHDHGRPVPRRYADYTTSGLRMAVNAENAMAQRVVLEIE